MGDIARRMRGTTVAIPTSMHSSKKGMYEWMVSLQTSPEVGKVARVSSSAAAASIYGTYGGVGDPASLARVKLASRLCFWQASTSSTFAPLGDSRKGYLSVNNRSKPRTGEHQANLNRSQSEHFPLETSGLKEDCGELGMRTSSGTPQMDQASVRSEALSRETFRSYQDGVAPSTIALPRTDDHSIPVEEDTVLLTNLQFLELPGAIAHWSDFKAVPIELNENMFCNPNRKAMHVVLYFLVACLKGREFARKEFKGKWPPTTVHLMREFRHKVIVVIKSNAEEWGLSKDKLHSLSGMLQRHAGLKLVEFLCEMSHAALVEKFKKAFPEKSGLVCASVQDPFKFIGVDFDEVENPERTAEMLVRCAKAKVAIQQKRFLRNLQKSRAQRTAYRNGAERLMEEHANLGGATENLKVKIAELEKILAGTGGENGGAVSNLNSAARVRRCWQDLEKLLGEFEDAQVYIEKGLEMQKHEHPHAISAMDLGAKASEKEGEEPAEDMQAQTSRDDTDMSEWALYLKALVAQNETLDHLPGASPRPPPSEHPLLFQSSIQIPESVKSYLQHKQEARQAKMDTNAPNTEHCQIERTGNSRFSGGFGSSVDCDDTVDDREGAVPSLMDIVREWGSNLGELNSALSSIVKEGVGELMEEALSGDSVCENMSTANFAVRQSMESLEQVKKELIDEGERLDAEIEDVWESLGPMLKGHLAKHGEDVQVHFQDLLDGPQNASNSHQ